MVAETRSKRRATYDEQTVSSYLQDSSPYHQQTPYPQFTSSSVPQSAPSSLESSSSLSGFGAVQQGGMLTATHQSAAFSSAPLPSPSANRQSNGYFGSFTSAQPQQNAAASYPAVQQQMRIQPGQGGLTGQHHGGQRGNGGGAPETAPFLKDFNLVAEAAKRAQVACLTRDLDEIGL